MDDGALTADHKQISVCNDQKELETGDDSAFSYHETDIATVSYVLEAVRCGKSNIRVLSDDIDVVLMVYWIF